MYKNKIVKWPEIEASVASVTTKCNNHYMMIYTGIS